MAISKNEKTTVISGLCGGRVAIAGADGTWGSPMDFKYLTSLGLKNLINNNPQYADSMRIALKPSDTGIEGEIGTTSQDVAFEKAVGYLIDADQGALAEVKIHGYVKCCFYFEHDRTDAATGVNYKVKTWLFNAIVGKPTEESHESNNENPSIASYKYPINIDGVNMKDAAGTAEVIDENGYNICVYKFTSCPGDAGYATFGDAVPVVKKASA